MSNLVQRRAGAVRGAGERATGRRSPDARSAAPVPATDTVAPGDDLQALLEPTLAALIRVAGATAGTLGVGELSVIADAPDAGPRAQAAGVVRAGDAFAAWCEACERSGSSDSACVRSRLCRPLADRPGIDAAERGHMARLAAEIDRRQELMAKRPKRKFISASTQEYEYASYMRAWVQKVERVGNLNYPEQARRQGPG